MNIYSDKDVNIDLNIVLAMLECKKDNPAYDEIVAIYNKQLPIVKEMISPKGAYITGELLRDGNREDIVAGSKVIYSMVTLGMRICSYIDSCMERDALTGLIVNHMADSCLFGFEDKFRKVIKEYCTIHNIGISGSYSVPDCIPMECQHDAWTILNAEKNLGIYLTSAYMMSPIKSDSTLYAISENSNELKLAHDCSNCQLKTCLLSKNSFK